MKQTFYNLPATCLLPEKRSDIFSLLFVLSILFIIAWACSNLGGNIDYQDIHSIIQYKQQQSSITTETNSR